MGRDCGAGTLIPDLDWSSLMRVRQMLSAVDGTYAVCLAAGVCTRAQVAPAVAPAVIIIKAARLTDGRGGAQAAAGWRRAALAPA